MKAYYKATVTDGVCRDHLDIIVYAIDANKKSVGFDFKRLVYSIDNKDITIPANRQANFKEELLCIGKSSVVAEQLDINKYSEFIKQKLKEAYGSTAIVYVEQQIDTSD